MRDRESTVRSRELGDALRAAMERSGLSSADVARKLEWSQARVSRLLSGKRGTGESSIAAFMAVVGLTGDRFDRLLEISREMNKPGWLQRFGSRVPKQIQTLVDHEDRAIAILEFEQTCVPGLLQTSAYARAVIGRNPRVPVEQIEERVRARAARRSILSRSPQIEFTFFVHEFALHLPVGGSAAMSAQLHHLLQMSVRPSISLRVVPIAVGAHAGMAGAFRLMEFADVRSVVYAENETCGLFLEEAAETLAYRTILADLAETALSEGQSRQLIARLATELYSGGEGRDDLEDEQL